jgi:hypothetical protein
MGGGPRQWLFASGLLLVAAVSCGGAIDAPASAGEWLAQQMVRYQLGLQLASGQPQYAFNAETGRFEVVGEPFSLYAEYDPASADPALNSPDIRCYFSPSKANCYHPDNIYQAVDGNGARVVLGGHSNVKTFMGPLAVLAWANGKRGQEAAVEIGPSIAGSPVYLWERPAMMSRLKDMLRTGAWDHFVLPTFPVVDTGWEAKDFEPWFDLARQHNPDIKLYVQDVWALALEGENVDWRVDTHLLRWQWNKLIDDLEAKYGQGRVMHIPMLDALDTLWLRGNNGMVPGYKGLIAPDEETRGYLLDAEGVHPSTWMRQLGAAVYYQSLYGQLPPNPYDLAQDDPADPYDDYSQWAVALDAAQAMQIPEPAALWMLVAGIGVVVRRRRRHGRP